MKTYRILKTFLGNQNGFGETEKFSEGTEAALSDGLAAVAVSEGWAEPVSHSAQSRETKVIAPEETKPDAPEEPKVAKKGKK